MIASQNRGIPISTQNTVFRIIYRDSQWGMLSLGKPPRIISGWAGDLLLERGDYVIADPLTGS